MQAHTQLLERMSVQDEDWRLKLSAVESAMQDLRSKLDQNVGWEQMVEAKVNQLERGMEEATSQVCLFVCATPMCPSLVCASMF